jgi:hypothetical protein
MMVDVMNNPFDMHSPGVKEIFITPWGNIVSIAIGVLLIYTVHWGKSWEFHPPFK